MSNANQSNDAGVADERPDEEGAESLNGRAVFVVETTEAGIAVQTAFVSDDNRLFRAPAVFPDLGYALSQIDELRALVIQHFSRAAQVGAKVISQNAQQNP